MRNEPRYLLMMLDKIPCFLWMHPWDVFVVKGMALPRGDFVVAIRTLDHVPGLAALVAPALMFTQVIVDIVGGGALATLELFGRLLVMPGHFGGLEVGRFLGHVVNFVKVFALFFPVGKQLGVRFIARLEGQL